ncbi:MAG: STAS domain-containing protein [Planctomycetota bacterium]
MPEADGLSVTSELREGCSILKLAGDIDMSRSPVLREAIRNALESRPNRLVIDLEGVDYMDSSGLATLVEAMKVTKKQKTTLVLCAMSDKVRAIFEIARLDSYFNIVASVDDAAGV